MAGGSRCGGAPAAECDGPARGPVRASVCGHIIHLPLRKKRALPVVILAAGIAFSLYAVREVFVYRPCVRLDGRTVQVEAQVIETYTNGAVDLRVLEGCEIPKGVGLILFLGDQAEHPDLYERVSGRLTVRAEDLSDLRNLGYKAGGFYLTAVPEEYGGAALRYEAMDPPWTAPFQRAGRLAQGVLMTYLPDDRGGLASLITVGRGIAVGGGAGRVRFVGRVAPHRRFRPAYGDPVPGGAVSAQKAADSALPGGALDHGRRVRLYGAGWIPRFGGAGGGSVSRGAARFLCEAAVGQPEFHRARPDPAAGRGSLCRV